MTLPALTLEGVTIGQLDKLMKKMGGFGSSLGKQRVAARKALQQYQYDTDTGNGFSNLMFKAYGMGPAKRTKPVWAKKTGRAD